MLDIEYDRKIINGVSVVATPAQIDITTADQLRAVLLDAASGGHLNIIVDMTRTRFCDSSGIHVLVRAHQRVAAEHRDLRLVLGADSPVRRIAALTGIDLVIPCFTSLEEALAHTPDGASPPHDIATAMG